MESNQGFHHDPKTFYHTAPTHHPVRAVLHPGRRSEASNALAEARRGGLNDAPGDYDRNAVQRCAEFQGDDRIACEARVRNPSRLEGSVEGGGLLREAVTVTPSR